MEAYSLQAHQHDIIYYGVVNLVEESKIIGTIDVWRCRSCNDLFCEDKRFGATDLVPEVGFPRVDPGSKWAALVCSRDGGSTWTLTSAKPGTTVAHSCTPETKLELRIGAHYDVEQGPIGKHRIILIEKFVNAAVDVDSGLTHVGTTDAYQAVGKPFSLTPPLSAAIAESSKLQVFMIAGGALVGSGILGLIGAYSQPSLVPKVVLGATSVAGLFSGYLLLGKRMLGAILGLAAASLELIIYNSLLISGGNAFGILDFILIPVFVVDLFLSFTARTRLGALRRQKWHPLDMPAYG